MSTLRRQEPVGLGLRRIACTQVEAAIRSLTRQPGQASDAVAAMRGAEAALSLIEPNLPRPVVRRDRGVIARLGTGLDELTLPTMLQDRLGSRYKKAPSDSALASAVKQLNKQWAGQATAGVALSSRVGSFNPAIYRLVADMAELRGHVGNWPIDAAPDDTPPRGARRAYNKARRLIHQPITRESLAELIAALGVLEQQLSILGKSCSGMLKAQRKMISRAADQLQTMRADSLLDSALRKQLKDTDAAPPRSEPLAKTAAAVIESDLTNALAETPPAFMNRLAVYWSAWRSD